MRVSIRRVRLLLLVSGWLAVIPPAFAANQPNQFCTGDPCVIDVDRAVDNLAIVDFGSRAVVLNATLDVGTGSATFLAGSFTMNSTGQILGLGTSTLPGGTFTLTTTGNIQLLGTKTTGAVRMNGTSGGGLNLRSTGGSITTNKINSFNTDINGSGGSVSIDAATNVQLNLALDLNGGDQGNGGEIDINAGGNITAAAELNVNGGQGGAGSMIITAVGSITLDAINADGQSVVGDGGDITVAAGGVLTLNDNVNISGASGSGSGGSGADCGDAGYLDLEGDQVIIGDAVKLNSLLDCSGGEAVISGRIVRVAATFEAEGLGEFGAGGLVEIFADELIEVTPAGSILTDGGDSGAGDIALVSDGDMTLRGNVKANGRGTFGSGAFLELEAVGDLLVTKDLDASGGTQGIGGAIIVSACSVTIDSGTTDRPRVNAKPAAGSIEILANNQLTLDGFFDADPAAASNIVVGWGPAANPPNIGSSVFDPAPLSGIDPGLTPCCETDLECVDQNPCTTDSCGSARRCLNVANSLPCSDGNACTAGDACSLGSCVPGPPLVCSDNQFCNGVETCNPASGCRPGVPPPLSDGVDCTNDTCDEVNDVIVHTPVHLTCNDSNACTDDVCHPTQDCINTPNSALSCDDGIACTVGDTCSSGSCVPGAPVHAACQDGQFCNGAETCSPTSGCVAGVPPVLGDGVGCTADSCDETNDVIVHVPVNANCNDSDICTTDVCDAVNDCQNAPVAGCSDLDGDQILDAEDACTTLSASVIPEDPPNQHPNRAMVVLKGLDLPSGQQQLVAKGFFNPATTTPPLNPALHGVHIRLVDRLGELFDVNIPPGLVGSPGQCGARDGWVVKVPTSGRTLWRYGNVSGALPPACLPGSANGVKKVMLKDMRTSTKAAFLYDVRTKISTLIGAPEFAVRRLQFTLAFGAQPTGGTAGPEAIAGQCTEKVFAGNPIPTGPPKPFCKRSPTSGPIRTLACKAP
jgi:hypothetical protein